MSTGRRPPGDKDTWWWNDDTKDSIRAQKEANQKWETPGRLEKRETQVVIAIDRHTRDGRPIYPMLKSIKISLILASDWSSAIKIVMNIDESGFRMPLSFSRQMAPVVSIVRHQVAPLVRAYFCMAK